jgi:hypothetical protein
LSIRPHGLGGPVAAPSGDRERVDKTDLNRYNHADLRTIIASWTTLSVSSSYSGKPQGTCGV